MEKRKELGLVQYKKRIVPYMENKLMDITFKYNLSDNL